MCTAPFAAWWLIGDLSEPELVPGDLSYIARAPDIPAWIVTAIGCIALVSAIGAIAVMLLGIRRGRSDGHWLPSVILLVIAGVVLAGIGRVVTAGSIGANIGGGLAILFGLPFVAILVGGSIVFTLRGRRVPTDA